MDDETLLLAAIAAAARNSYLSPDALAEQSWNNMTELMGELGEGPNIPTAAKTRKHPPPVRQGHPDLSSMTDDKLIKWTR